MGMDKNEDNIRNKVIKNIEVTNKIERTCGRSRNNSQEKKLQGPI